MMSLTTKNYVSKWYPDLRFDKMSMVYFFPMGVKVNVSIISEQPS